MNETEPTLYPCHIQENGTSAADSTIEKMVTWVHLYCLVQATNNLHRRKLCFFILLLISEKNKYKNQGFDVWGFFLINCEICCRSLMCSVKCYTPTHSKEESGACMTLFNVLVGKTYMAIKSNPISLFFFILLFFSLGGRQGIIFWLTKRRTCPKAWWQLCLNFSFFFSDIWYLVFLNLSTFLLSEILGDLKYTICACASEGKARPFLVFNFLFDLCS